MALGILDLIDRIGASRAMMRFLTIYCAFGFLVLLASNIWSISTWTETRGAGAMCSVGTSSGSACMVLVIPCQRR